MKPLISIDKDGKLEPVDPERLEILRDSFCVLAELFTEVFLHIGTSIHTWYESIPQEIKDAYTPEEDEE